MTDDHGEMRHGTGVSGLSQVSGIAGEGTAITRSRAPDLAAVAILIVNYRTPRLVMDCLASLRCEIAAGLPIRVFVGDAASGDDSTARIQDYIATEDLGGWAHCIDLGRNGGFAFGNNELYRRCVAPDPGFGYVHFLNPDTYVRPGAVTALVRFLEDHPDAGAAGSRLENPDGSPQSCAFRFPAPWREFFRGARTGILDRAVPSAPVAIPTPAHSLEVDWVSGASFMMPRRVLDAVGLMDEGCFLYFEEPDLMKRVRASGRSVWHVADSRVVHLMGQSSGPGEAGDDHPRLSPFWLQSRARFLRRHHGRAGPALGNLLFLSGDAVYRLQRGLLGRPVQNPPGLWRAYLSHGERGRS